MDIPVNSNLEEYEIEVAESVVIGEVTLGIGDTVTGEAGTDALVENTGDDKNIVLKFTIPRGANGADGDDGVGIASVVLNQDYTLTITLTDGRSYTTTSIRGEIGPQGPSGDDGYSPIASVSKSGKITTISITDKSGTTTAEVHDGEDGQSGSDGVGIASVVLNSDYTLTITLTDGRSYTTTSVRGETGPAGRDGQNGYSPEVTIDTITGGHRVTITDAEHPSGQSFEVHDGEDGQSGSDGVGIASVVLNQDYTLTITLTNGTSYTTTSIRGATGPAGQSGNDGYSPEVTITTITGGHRVNITDAEHPSGQSFDVMDGEDGQSGSDGVGIASVSLNQDYTLTITLTNGTSYTTTSIRGATGQSGNDGYSPEVTITEITGGHRVTITDETHPTGQSFDVMDGEDGGGSGGGIPVVEATRSGGALSVTVDGITELSDGLAVAVKLPSDSWTTSTSNVTLNVNGLGAKSVYNLNGNIVKLDALSPGEIQIFVYAVNTTSYKNTWRMLEKDLVYEGIARGTVTGAGTTRTMTASGFKLKVNSIVAALFNSAVVANATLNINSRGAKPIYYKNSAIVDGIIGSGDTALLMYDGVHWQVLSVDNIGGGGSYADGDSVSY